jgi:hypothetical protein
MDPRVSAALRAFVAQKAKRLAFCRPMADRSSPFGLLSPRMTKGWGIIGNRHRLSLVETPTDFVILGRSRSEANCADPRIHAVMSAQSATAQTATRACRLPTPIPPFFPTN